MKIIGLIVALSVVAIMLAPMPYGLVDGLFGLFFGLLVGLLGGIFGLVVGLVGGVLGLVVGLVGLVFGLGVGAIVLAAPILIVVALVYGTMKALSAART